MCLLKVIREGEVERARLLIDHIALEKLASVLLPLVKMYLLATCVQRKLGNGAPGWAGPSQPQLFTLEGEHEYLGAANLLCPGITTPPSYLRSPSQQPEEIQSKSVNSIRTYMKTKILLLRARER